MISLLPPLLALTLAGDGAKLELLNMRGTYGHLGAKRPAGGGIMPGDIAYFSFDVKNLKLDKAGKASYAIAIEVRDASDHIVYELKPQNATARNLFGGNLLPCSSFLEVPPDAKPGPVTWKVTVHDRAAGTKAEAHGKGKILPPDFALVQVGTFADSTGRIAAPPVGVIGENLFVHFAVVGFGRNAKTKQPDIVTSLKVVDEGGKVTSAPLTGEIKSDVADDARIVHMGFGLTMNREGRFTLELTGRCQVSGKTMTVTLPVRVLGHD
jgi:hypothetical protein